VILRAKRDDAACVYGRIRHAGALTVADARRVARELVTIERAAILVGPALRTERTAAARPSGALEVRRVPMGAEPRTTLPAVSQRGTMRRMAPRLEAGGELIGGRIRAPGWVGKRGGIARRASRNEEHDAERWDDSSGNFQHGALPLPKRSAMWSASSVPYRAGVANTAISRQGLGAQRPLASASERVRDDSRLQAIPLWRDQSRLREKRPADIGGKRHTEMILCRDCLSTTCAD
jgi:hypothetical protein